MQDDEEFDSAAVDYLTAAARRDSDTTGLLRRALGRGSNPASLSEEQRKHESQQEVQPVS